MATVPGQSDVVLPDASVGTLLRSVCTLSGPLVAANVSRTLMGFVDFAMVSALGPEAQAAVFPAGVMVFVVIAFGFGISACVNTFVSQALGRQELRQCGEFAWAGMYVSVAVGVIALAAWPVMPGLFNLFGHEPEVIRLEVIYGRLMLLTVAPTLLGKTISDFFTGIHKPMVMLVATVLSNIFNVGANYVLIFGKFGFPALGVAGAGWGTLAATLVYLAIMGGAFFYKKYRIPFYTMPLRGPSADHIGRLLALGVPMGLQFTADVVAWAVFTAFLVGAFGTEALAANNIVIQWIHVSFMPAVGIGMALTALVGKAIGQGHPDLAVRYTRLTLGLCLAYMGVMGGLFLVIPGPLADLFTDEPGVMHWTRYLFMLGAAFQLFDAMGIIYTSALRGTGDTKWPAVASIILCYGVFIPGALWIRYSFPQAGPVGPWIFATIYIILLGLALWWRFARGAWRRIDLFSSQDEHQT